MKYSFRIFISFLFCTLLCLFLSTVAIAEENLLSSGYCGAYDNNLNWELYTSGKLIIKGNGPMRNYSDRVSPWYDDRMAITSVRIENGVTSIGSFAFDSCCNLVNVTLPESLLRIGGSAFENCNSLINIFLPDSLQSIDNFAFYENQLEYDFYLMGMDLFESFDEYTISDDEYCREAMDDWYRFEKALVKDNSSPVYNELLVAITEIAELEE